MRSMHVMVLVVALGLVSSSALAQSSSQDEVAQLTQDVLASRQYAQASVRDPYADFMKEESSSDKTAVRKETIASSTAPTASSSEASDDGPFVKIKGVARASMGIESNGTTVWRQANGDLNERNYRITSHDALNNAENTFDPAIYQRLKVVMDAGINQAISMHLNVTVDPWSYTGKTSNQRVSSRNGTDSANIQYLYTGATPYAVGRIVNTNTTGDGLAMPEIKRSHNIVPATTIDSNWNTYDIQAMKLEYTFNPVRELWFDIKPGDKGTFRIFPMGYQDQALTTDDPMRLSNNKMYWEGSPWLRGWTKGNVNQSDFTKGTWETSLSSFRDSDGNRLTALRGVSLDMRLTEDSSLKATLATPKTIWDDYSTVTAIPGSARWSQTLTDSLLVGITGNMHTGLVDGKVDAENYVKSADAAFMLFDGVEILGQVSESTGKYDQLTPEYTTKDRGNAYYVSLEGSTDPEDMLHKDYFGQRAPKGDSFFAKSRVFFARMDNDFESSLSNYHETRDDSYWSRHLTFYPSTYGNLPGTEPITSEYDLESFAIGNGIDQGRKVVGWRGDVELLEGKIKGLADVRYVTDTNDHHIETVSRTQWEYKPIEKLSTKLMLLKHDLPKTTAEVDPFVVDGVTGRPLANKAVPGGEDPSLNTGTLGARYEITDAVAINGVWERTNDKTLATDNFPMGALNSSNFETYTDDTRLFRRPIPFLYTQQYFDQAPYEYYNIFKAGLELKLMEKWMIYLDYTRNPNKFAGNIDDNINHWGVETSYVPFERFGLFARYTFSKWYNLEKLANNNELKYQSYNNMFLEGRYFKKDDMKLSLQYGVGPSYTTDVSTTNPSVAYYSSPVLETEHLIRMIYEKKF